MTPEKINDHIDKKILEQLAEGFDLSELVNSIDNDINRFTAKKSFVRISSRYLFNNWDNIEIKKRYTTYLVIRYTKRKKDIEWILKNKENFKGVTRTSDLSLFKLVKLKEKLS